MRSLSENQLLREPEPGAACRYTEQLPEEDQAEGADLQTPDRDPEPKL